jgi:hypothetical protein
MHLALLLLEVSSAILYPKNLENWEYETQAATCACALRIVQYTQHTRTHSDPDHQCPYMANISFKMLGNITCTGVRILINIGQ